MNIRYEYAQAEARFKNMVMSRVVDYRANEFNLFLFAENRELKEKIKELERS